MSPAQPQPRFRFLGIDPGTRVAGWGVIESDGRAQLFGVAAGTYRLKDKDLAPRLCALRGHLLETLERYRPQMVIVEEVFVAQHARAALQLGHARGVILGTVAELGIPLRTLSPALVKRTVAGHGQASKEQVAKLVGSLLRLNKLPALDATDALALAIAGARAQHAPHQVAGIQSSSGVWKRGAL